MSTSGGADSTIQRLGREAQAALREGRVADAAHLLAQLRAQAPNDPNVDLFGGIIAYKQDRFIDAIAHFERLRRRHPDNATAQFWMANALRHDGRLDEAAEIYRTVMQRAPTDDARANLESTENLRRIESIGRHALIEDRRSPSEKALQAVVDRAADLARIGIGAPTKDQVPATAETTRVSFISCTITPEKLERLRTSLTAAMGAAAWELVAVTDARSLCEGYARGFARSRGEFVVFCHDDIEILCDRFHDRLMDSFDGADLIGVAGTTRLNGPMLAWAGLPHQHGAVTHRRDGAFCPGLCSSAGPRIDGAQALDGLFFAARREVVERIGFDADTFDGFDFYDVDFSYRAFKAGLHVRIQTDLTLLHASRGNFGPNYTVYSERFRKKFPEFADPPPFRRAYIHEAHVSSLDDTRRFHAWIGHWLRSVSNRD